MRVAVFGAGPAGLLAALAVSQSGHEPVIYSRKEKSPMFGAMYLHEAIPGLSDGTPDFHIEITKIGTRAGYAYNVYGDPDAPCSWDDIPEVETPAWDMHRAYDKLWSLFERHIQPAELSRDNVGVIANNYDLTLCTVPAPMICGFKSEHEFSFQEIGIVHGYGRALIRGVNDDSLMYYNGIPWDGSDETGMIGNPWYRFSQIKGYQAWEYPITRMPEVSREEQGWGRQAAFGRKPLATSCNCWQMYPGFHRLGRFGKWTKGVLTHHAYREAMELCRAL